MRNFVAMYYWWIYLFFWKLCTVRCVEKEMTISIDPRRQECFYQNVQEGQVIDVEYQVIDSGHGELDINFHLSSPSGRTVAVDFKKSENSHRIAATEDGDYKICWDNSFSHISSKTVFFEIIIESEDEEGESWDIDFENYDSPSPEELYDMKLQDIQDVITRVHGHLSKVRHLQDTLRAFEARDRNIAEGNFVRVNSWSIIQIVVMLVVGLIQVVMVRSLFDDTSRVQRFLKKMQSS
ncbi:transmembrane emp24 domain-containing protein 5 [Anabrus simplex]|uniref:transmembrane emp24 domain-containing protein 5 n=1 Tax=Anabrus simplex TaxID=316456 RepID=UPI0034DD693A